MFLDALKPGADHVYVAAPSTPTTAPGRSSPSQHVPPSGAVVTTTQVPGNLPASASPPMPSWADIVVAVTAAIAIILSSRSIWLSKKANRTAERADHRASMPKLRAEYVPTLGGGDALRVWNDGPHDLSAVEVRLVPTLPPHQYPRVTSIGLDGTDNGEVISLGPLLFGESRDVHLWRSGRIDGQTVRLRCRCIADRFEPWDVLVEDTVKDTRPH